MAVRDPDVGWPPWYFVIPAGLYFVGVFYLLIVDPRSTLRLDDTSMVLERGRKPTIWLLAEIEQVRITEWSDNTSVYVHLRDGQRQMIPDFCTPTRLDPFIVALTWIIHEAFAGPASGRG